LLASKAGTARTHTNNDEESDGTEERLPSAASPAKGASPFEVALRRILGLQRKLTEDTRVRFDKMYLRNGAKEYKGVEGWKKFIADAFEHRILAKVENKQLQMVSPVVAILNGEVGSIKKGSTSTAPALELDIEQADAWLTGFGSTQMLLEAPAPDPQEEAAR
jgi:hypothetical protein